MHTGRPAVNRPTTRQNHLCFGMQCALADAVDEKLRKQPVDLGRLPTSREEPASVDLRLQAPSVVVRQPMRYCYHTATERLR